jgi:hypothetical protein
VWHRLTLGGTDGPSATFRVPAPRWPAVHQNVSCLKAFGAYQSPSKALTDNDFTDLNDRGLVGVIYNVSHDLLRVWPEASLKGLNGVAEDVAHAHVRGRCARRSAGKAFVNRVILAAVAHPALHERHMLVAVVLVVESCPRSVGIHHADFDHGLSPSIGVGNLRRRIVHHRHPSEQAHHAVTRLSPAGS